MSELALFLVRFGFMAVLWIFIFSIISVIRADLFGQRVVGRATERSVPTVLSTPIIPSAPTGAVSVTAAAVGRSSASAARLVVTEGESIGREIALTGREIHIGRAPNSDLVVSDEYASTQHAKLVLMNEDWLIQDLNSTNGTYLAGARVGTPAVVKLNTPVKIGKTVFELRA
jgi:hypothetical protein